MSDQVKTWTVEEIEEAADQVLKGVNLNSYAHYAAMLRAFAAQTRQVETTRKWLDMLEGKHTPQCAASRRLFTRMQRKFALMFPKDGAQ